MGFSQINLKNVAEPGSELCYAVVEQPHYDSFMLQEII